MGNKLTKYCDLYLLHLFCNIVQLQYVGTKTYDTHRILHEICLALSGQQLVSKINGKTIFLTPDTLYQRFIEFSSLLIPNTTAWSFSLVTLLCNALSVELHEAVRLDRYNLPNNSTLATLSDQTSTLQVLRGKSVVGYKLQFEEKKRVLSLLKSLSTRSTSLNYLEADLNPMYSQAETTIRAHHPFSTIPMDNRPLVKGTDGKFYPKNPINNYVSRFSDEFIECLGCGSVSHFSGLALIEQIRKGSMIFSGSIRSCTFH